MKDAPFAQRFPTMRSQILVVCLTVPGGTYAEPLHSSVLLAETIDIMGAASTAHRMELADMPTSMTVTARVSSFRFRIENDTCTLAVPWAMNALFSAREKLLRLTPPSEIWRFSNSSSVRS